MSQKPSGSGSPKKKIFEPTLHFTTKRVQIGEDEGADKVLVAELVRKGDMLLNFEGFERFKLKGFEMQKIEAGQNTYFSKDKTEIFSAVAGYPRADRYNAEEAGGHPTVISVEPLFRVSHDEMKASVVVHPPLEGCCSLKNEDLDQLLQEEGIVFGLNQEKVDEAKDFICQGLMEFATFPIATGLESGESSDAFLEFQMEIGPIAGKILEDGSIDFRERRIMVPVDEGDVLAKKIPAEPGTPGKNVFGLEIEASQGKDIKVKTKGYASYSDDTLEVVATGSGVLSVVGGNVLQVSTKQKIESDIDFSTGNVESKNCVIIRGSVQPGFTVKAEGDIEVGGTVSSATIECGANVVIKSGITGKKTIVSAKGDADILFIEQGRIVTGGNCVIRKQAYYSIVHAGESIRCRKDSVVVGGELVAADCISFGDVGSEKSTPSLIAAGVAAERLQLFKDLKAKQSELQDEIIRQLQQGGGRSRKLRKFERDAEEIKQQIQHLNMIPGTGLYSRVGKSDEKLFTEEEYSDEFGIDLRKIAIDVFGSIQVGTKLQIGNRTLVLDKTISGRRFKLNDALRRILAVPLARK